MTSSSSMLDRLKPRRSEAIARIRTNGLGLAAVAIMTNLLPVPGPWEATRQVWQSYSYRHNGRESMTVWWAMCFVELIVLATFTFNVLQASYALQFPPAPLPPPTPSPAKPKPSPMEIAARSPKSPSGLGQSQRKLVGVTPSSGPHPQKSFSSSFYASSPASTPSRILNYSTTSGLAGADASFGSTFSSSSLPGSPSPTGSGVLSSSLLGMSMGVTGSPTLAAYRGKHRSGAGRAFDGDLLNRLTQSTANDDAEED